MRDYLRQRLFLALLVSRSDTSRLCPRHLSLFDVPIDSLFYFVPVTGYFVISISASQSPNHRIKLILS